MHKTWRSNALYSQNSNFQDIKDHFQSLTLLCKFAKMMIAEMMRIITRWDKITKSLRMRIKMKIRMRMMMKIMSREKHSVAATH